MVFIQKIFQNRNLALLWLGQMASQSGDSIYQIGLLWLVLELSGSTSVTGMVAMASYLPAVLFSLVAGVAADRNRRRVMRACRMDFCKGSENVRLTILAKDRVVFRDMPAQGLPRADASIQLFQQYSSGFPPARE